MFEPHVRTPMFEPMFEPRVNSYSFLPMFQPRVNSYSFLRPPSSDPFLGPRVGGELTKGRRGIPLPRTRFLGPPSSDQGSAGNSTLLGLRLQPKDRLSDRQTTPAGNLAVTYDWIYPWVGCGYSCAKAKPLASPNEPARCVNSGFGGCDGNPMDYRHLVRAVRKHSVTVA